LTVYVRESVMSVPAVEIERGVGRLLYLASKVGIEVSLGNVNEKLHAKGIFIPELMAIVLDPGLEGMERVAVLAHELGHGLLFVENPASARFRINAAIVWKVPEALRDEETLAWSTADELVKTLDLYNEEYRCIKDECLLAMELECTFMHLTGRSSRDVLSQD
jgi:hypothetical protein